MRTPRKRKPCPGCNQVDQRRPADQVCHECQQLIKEALARRAELQRTKEAEPAKLPHSAHCLPYIPNVDGDERDVIQRFVFGLVKMVGTPTKWNAKWFPPQTYSRTGYIIEGKSGCDSGGTTYWLVPRGLVKMLQDLYAAILAGSANAYAEGFSNGHNLILGLATGETSIDDFNEQSAQSARSMQKKKKGTRKRS